MRWILGITITAFWAVMMTVYVKEYVLPDIALQSEPSYRTAFVKALEADEYSTAILFLSQRVGTMRTRIEPRPDGGCSISSDTEMSIPMLGKEGVMKLSMISRLDRTYALRSIEMTVDSGLMQAKVTGVVSQSALHLSFRTPEGFNEAVVPLSGKETLSNGLSPFINMPHLAVGKEWDIFMIDPLTLGTTRAIARVESIEPLLWKGAIHDTFLVTLEDSRRHVKQPKQIYRAWIDTEGRVLREEIGAGVVLERE